MRRTVVRAVSIVLIVSLGGWLVFESPLFDSPERHVARYLEATSFGDLPRALNEWSVYEGRANVSTGPITARRRELTVELASNRVGRHYTITSVEYWRTCCTPGRVADARAAGLARVHVTTTGENGATYRLVFEVWVKDLTWWGDAAGEWMHDWRLYEVHAEDEACVFPNPAYGCIRSFG